MSLRRNRSCRKAVLAIAFALCAGLLARPACATPPSIVQAPQSLTVKQGRGAQFDVEAVGVAPFAYHWYHTDSGGDTQLIAACTGRQCVIGPTTAAAAGSYNVEVYDANGEHAHGAAATLTVLPVAAETLHVAGSCSAADVKAAIAEIPPGGSGTVVIPTGTCDWVGDLVVVSGKANIAIRGAGRDATTIRRSAADDGDSVLDDEHPAAIFTFDCTGGQRVDFSGLHLQGTGNTALYSRGLELRGHCRDFQVHDLRISRFTYTGMEVKGWMSKGVIYRNEFLDNWRNGLGYGVTVMGWNTSVNPQYWPPSDIGGDAAVFIEDNLFSGQRHNVASNAGSRYVFRHNRQIVWRTNSNKDSSLLETFWDGQVDAHGWNASPGQVGSRTWEIYDNVFSMAADVFKANVNASGSESSPSGISLRGGNGMVFCNRFEQGAHGGTLRFTPPIIAMEDVEHCASLVWPVNYQQGYQGHGFFWDNNNGAVTNGGVVLHSTYLDDSGICAAFLQENRDYFNHAPSVGEFGADYRIYPYPHPLRDDAIFRERFEVPLSCEPGPH